MSPKLVPPLPLHRAQAGEPVVGVAELIEWLLANDPATLPAAITRGVARLMLDELRRDGVQQVITPEFAPGMRRGEGAPA